MIRWIMQIVSRVTKSQKCPLSKDARAVWCKKWNCSQWDTCTVKEEK